MEVFIRQIPVHSSDKQIKQFFKPYLAEFGINTFEVSKFPNKPLANITVLDATKGHLFLRKYGCNVARAPPLIMNGNVIKCSLSNRTPTEFQLKTLTLEAARQLSKTKGLAQDHKVQLPDRSVTTFATMSLSCGVWTYVGDRLTYSPYLVDSRPGELVVGLRQVVLLLQSDTVSADRVNIDCYNIDTILTGDHKDPTVTFTLFCPPKFYREDAGLLAAAMARLGFITQTPSVQQPKRLRLPNIRNTHQHAAGMCFVYQIRLTKPAQLAKVHQLIAHHRHIQSVMAFPTPTLAIPAVSLQDSMIRLNFELTDQARSGSLPFGIRFQIFRLAQNGKLMPDQARALLPCINCLYEQYEESATVNAVNRLYLHLSPAGPHTEASEYAQTSLVKLLNDYAYSYSIYGAEDAYTLANRHSHIVLIHKINVTPAGTYLEGPFAEVTNRVLRQYPKQIGFFVRVCFMDEDGESVRYDPHASQDIIYHQRFKGFMDGTYNIAGQGFTFLGFSNSSIRAQTCWFMAPFFEQGILVAAVMVIKRLGDFTEIRSPARCAARIGQAFTDTTGTVEVQAGKLLRVPDVARNGRTFSDGVGTISNNLIEKVWRVYGTKRALKPTVLQIRYAGAKGVVSLDARIPGDQLTIRPSMEKFPGSTSTNIEVCGAAFRPLPMILNRGYIKILEDLGVPLQVFMELQEAAVDELAMITSSTINASIFLSSSLTSKTAQLPALLEHIYDIGLDYHTDTFLRDVVEMAVVTKLRDIKYHGRIPVQNGVTLYGIMDETGYLQEGEIYVVTEKPPEGGKQVLTGGKVVITRSPALHPGDIRIVRAVDVPDDSPLGQLSNCVVFSQHGARDLPSQLSGGDLDGDLYNVIFEPGLMPQRDIAEPADYPRVKPVELDRPVTSQDMSDFFVNFMETDQLGQISIIHVQLADQRPDGVFDVDCIKLAQMASTAVDFSKTGIPVNMKECPKRDRNRPDFMAPSPRAIIENGGLSILQEEEHHDDEDDPVADLNPETRRIRYYESEKALGHLYRAIDERRFLSDLHKGYKSQVQQVPRFNLMSKLWDYVKRNNVLLEWEHNRQLARQIKEAYETKLLDILYQFAPSPHHPITESELFSGTILGRAGGASSRRLRDITTTMRERFEEILGFTVSRIVNGDVDGSDRNDEALPRAIACFAVGVEESSLYDRKLGAELKSWKYIAAGICLREMKRWIGGGRYVSLPRV